MGIKEHTFQFAISIAAACSSYLQILYVVKMNLEAKAIIKAGIEATESKGRKEFGISESLVDYFDKFEPDWDSGFLNGYAASYPPRDNITIYQQDELLYPVLHDIADKGLGYVYSKYKTGTGTSSTTANPRKVIVVGAGIAGLAAAYELTRAGHNVQILEMQARAGGRIHTYGEKDGFAKNLYVDGKQLISLYTMSKLNVHVFCSWSNEITW